MTLGNRARILVCPTASDAAARREIVERARKRGFTGFVVPEGEVLPTGPNDDVYLRSNGSLVSSAGSRPAVRAEISLVATGEELERVLERATNTGVAVIRWAGDRIIPLENALAQRSRGALIWVVTDKPSEIPAAIGALEHGADRVIVEVDELGALDLIEANLEVLEAPEGSWELVSVQRVTPAGIGDRVIVDTTSILRTSEGLLVGSAAAFLFHVASEAEGSRYTRPRPFRVNAGAAHSYTLLADGSTRYLAELGPGDAVLVADPAGLFRSARVGRIKTERRPLSLVEIERQGRSFTIFLQDAETVRVSGETGRVATTQLSPGDRIFGMALPAARHLGFRIDETIDER